MTSRSAPPLASPLLDPEALARLARFELRVQAVVEGTLSGLHKSPHRGQSVEFAEHKEYAPGDDVKAIDWRVFGRFDRYYVKEFEAETNLRAHLLLDRSASMGFQTAPLSKLEYASVLAASLGYLLLRQGDAVGLAPFGEAVTRPVAPRAGGVHLGNLLAALESLKARGRTRLGAALAQVAELARRRSLVVVLSDLLEGGDRGWLEALGRLRSRRHQVVVLHVLDPAERDFPYEGLRLFEDPEAGARVLSDARVVAAAYREELARFLEEVRRRCRQVGVSYHRAYTDEPPGEVLLELLGGARAGGSMRPSASAVGAGIR